MVRRYNEFERREVAMTALLPAIVSGIILLAVVRTLIVTVRDDRGRVPYRAAYDTRRPSP
ncbi:hypothetical protein CYJ73_23235 [Gordonia terrae]|uniref:Uncharacterized protein n=1 Tax=Gordonia terrae TaxID=2055 RepID=A0A2I1R228_9ACTN|nr:hypothetical protein CYJ73_23235 [Gordonia terrae]